VRLDIFLVSKGLAQSRTQAQDLIAGGFVFLKTPIKKTPLLKASYLVNDSEEQLVVVEANEIQKYVSRGGLKLESALKKLGLDVSNQTILDIGQSTGGFTDCLLHYHAKHIVGIDVGHGQLHEKIRDDARVIAFENLHTKNLSENENFMKSVPKGGFDLVVMDVSFISLIKLFPFIAPHLKKDGQFLFLVKPQFELSAADLDKNGIVKDPQSFSVVQACVEKEARLYFGSVLDYFRSEVLGKDGNQEFFIYGKKTS